MPVILAEHLRLHLRSSAAVPVYLHFNRTKPPREPVMIPVHLRLHLRRPLSRLPTSHTYLLHRRNGATDHRHSQPATQPVGRRLASQLAGKQ